MDPLPEVDFGKDLGKAINFNFEVGTPVPILSSVVIGASRGLEYKASLY